MDRFLSGVPLRTPGRASRSERQLGWVSSDVSSDVIVARRRGDDGAVRDVIIRDDVIRLGQFLKLAGLIDSGAEAKPLIADGEVRVNDAVESRRGCQLHRGDVVTVGDEVVRVA
jgi:ribosome-associated protein